MQVMGLDGKEYSINVATYVNKPIQYNKSSLHLKARLLLQELFPYEKIIEEVYLGGCLSKMYLDFFIPPTFLAFEIQGEQHCAFNQHFHKNKLAFFKAQNRDRQKREWCELNNIDLIELTYKETEDEWRQKINGGS